MADSKDFDKLLGHLENIELTTVHGRITEIIVRTIKGCTL